ncbi:MAG: hypothetical protein ABUK01_13045 [Leptospirales bacterium]
MKNQKKTLLLLLFMALFIAFTEIFAVSEKIYPLSLHRKGKVYSQKMSVSKSNGETIVNFTDEKGERSMNRFGAGLRALETKYYDKSGIEYMRIVFDYTKKEIVLTGKVKDDYNIDRVTYDGNGSMFYVFSRIIPKPGKKIIFDILQSKSGRVVAMYLVYEKTEEIIIAGKTYKAKKYESGLHNRVLKTFWPYKYYYWFDVKNNRFLKYEGPGEGKKTERIESP